jgi:hypothetical protein
MFADMLDDEEAVDIVVPRRGQRIALAGLHQVRIARKIVCDPLLVDGEIVGTGPGLVADPGQLATVASGVCLEWDLQAVGTAIDRGLAIVGAEPPDLPIGEEWRPQGNPSAARDPIRVIFDMDLRTARESRQCRVPFGQGQHGGQRPLNIEDPAMLAESGGPTGLGLARFLEEIDMGIADDMNLEGVSGRALGIRFGTGLLGGHLNLLVLESGVRRDAIFVEAVRGILPERPARSGRVRARPKGRLGWPTGGTH